jgi:hypothetical protein
VVTCNDDVDARVGAKAGLVAGLMTLMSGACLDEPETPPGGWTMRFSEAVLMPVACEHADRLRAIVAHRQTCFVQMYRDHWLYAALDCTAYPKLWLSSLFRSCGSLTMGLSEKLARSERRVAERTKTTMMMVMDWRLPRSCAAGSGHWQPK